MKKSTDTKETKKFEVKVKRAKAFTKTRTGFSMEVNGIDINDCVYIEWKDGDFISFPSYKDKNGAKDENGRDKYWNYAWFPISKELLADIKKQIEALL